jgi:flagellar L-ring protein precursor FlgH
MMMKSPATNRTRLTWAAGPVALALLALPARVCAQSLLVQPPPTPETQGVPPLLEPAASLQPYSMMAVVPPPPRTFQKHDLIQIIINETSVQKFEQKLDTNKEYDLNGAVETLPDLVKLLELRLEPGKRRPLAEVEVSGEREFKGDGKVERKDQVATRISARVIEVKPNGLLLLEARKTIQSDKESTTVVVSGLCRPEDVTVNNTVQSTQLADLVVRIENEGEARDAAKKGWISQVFDTVFAF